MRYVLWSLRGAVVVGGMGRERRGISWWVDLRALVVVVFGGQV